MEKQQLLERWHVLLSDPNAVDLSVILQERLTILHRLNELGIYDVEGLSIVKVLEATNELVWKTAKAARFASATLGTPP